MGDMGRGALMKDGAWRLTAGDGGGVVGRMSRRVIVVLGLLVLAGGVGGGLWWRSHTVWRAAVPAVQPVMPEAVALRVEELVGRLWHGEGGAAAAGELAMVYHANGYAAEAEQVYRVLTERDPTEPRWPYLLSELLGGEGRLGEAEPWLRRVVDLAPERVLARRKLGDLLFKDGRWAEAGAVYAAVLARRPGDPHARLGAARVAVEDQRWLEARRELEELVAAHPRFAGGLSLLATVDEILGETARAGEMRRRAEAAGRFRAERDPWDDELLQYCQTSYGLRVAAAASEDEAWSLQLLRRATRLEPEVVANWQQLGRALQAAGDLEGADAALARALEIEETEAQVWLDRVGVARARRDLAAVLAMVEAGLERCPQDAGLNYERGRALVQAERLREAIGPLQRAVALDPYNQTAAVELVALWFRLEEEEKAEAELVAALGRDPDFAPLLEFLVRFHVRGGREAEARAALERLERAPNHEAALANARREFIARFGAGK